MKFTIVGGGPSTGKTAILCHSIKALQSKGIQVAVAKIDCLDATSDQVYKTLNVPYIEGLSKDLCPDHYLATNYVDIFDWAKNQEAELLIVETAGLCNRCAPFVDVAMNICAVDYTTHIHAPLKFRPIVETASVIMLSKGDLISQSERMVFKKQLKRLNTTAPFVDVNGLTGQGYEALAKWLMSGQDLETLEGRSLSIKCLVALALIVLASNDFQKIFTTVLSIIFLKEAFKCLAHSPFLLVKTRLVKRKTLIS